MMRESLKITISDSARAHINDMLEKKKQPAYFRLSIKKTGCNGYMYVPDIVYCVAESEELIVINSGFEVVVPKSVFSLLNGTEVDFVLKQFGMKQLVFVHPDSAGVCGCGESFNFKKSD